MGQKLVHGPDPGPLHLIDGLDLDALAFRLCWSSCWTYLSFKSLAACFAEMAGWARAATFPALFFVFAPLGFSLGDGMIFPLFTK